MVERMGIVKGGWRVDVRMRGTYGTEERLTIQWSKEDRVRMHV
jgi:hypothetical protein